MLLEFQIEHLHSADKPHIDMGDMTDEIETTEDPLDFERQDTIPMDDDGDEFTFQGEDHIEGGEPEDSYDEPSDEKDEEPLAGMAKEEIIQAISEEFDVEVDEGKTRDELAEVLQNLRQERIDKAEEEVTPDWEEIVADDLLEDGDTAKTVEEAEQEEKEDTSEDESDEVHEVEALENQRLSEALKDQTEIRNPRKLTRAEAQQLINDMEGNLHNHQRQVMLMRWHEGLIAAATNVVYGEKTMEKLAKQTGVNVDTLRKCRQLVEHFNYDKQMYQKWLREGDGGSRWWSEALKEIRDDTTPDTDGDSDEEAEMTFLQEIQDEIESLAYRLQQINEMLESIEDEDTRREVEGVTASAMEEIQRFMRTKFAQTGELADEKTPIPRSDNYLNFMRDCPCPITGTLGSDPHHTETGGTADKGSDLSCVPLDREIHDELEDKGRKHFEQKYGENIDRMRYAYIHRFVTGQWPEKVNYPEPEGNW